MEPLLGFKGVAPTTPSDIRRCFTQIVRSQAFDLPRQAGMLERIERYTGVSSPMVLADFEEAIIRTAEAYHLERGAGEAAQYQMKLRTRRKQIKEFNKASKKGEFSEMPDEWLSDDLGLGPEPEALGMIPKCSLTGVQPIDEFIGYQAGRVIDGFDGELRRRDKLRKAKKRIERHLRKSEAAFSAAARIPGFATPVGNCGHNGEEPEALSTEGDGDTSGASKGASSKALLVSPSSHFSASPPRNQWDGSNDEVKACAMTRAIHEGSGGIAITVNLTNECVANAKAAGKTIPSHILDRLTKLLKRRFGFAVDVLIVLEQGLFEQPHLHGVIDLEDNKENREKVLAVLETLGTTPSVKPLKRQVNVQQLYAPERWGKYPFKQAATSRRNLRVTSTMAATRGLRRRGKAVYAERKKP